MAVPIVATNLTEAYEAIYINLHSISEGGLNPPFFTRLEAWRKQFFATLNKNDAKQKAIGYWAIPTSTLLGKLSGEAHQVILVQSLLNLVQNTLWAANFDGYVPAGAQETAMVAAFNAAWT